MRYYVNNHEWSYCTFVFKKRQNNGEKFCVKMSQNWTTIPVLNYYTLIKFTQIFRKIHK